MHLHRLEVKNFRRHEHLVLDMGDEGGAPRPLTLLVGANMSGKTTALDAIHLAYEVVRNNKSPAFRPGLDPSDPNLRPHPNEPIEVDLRFSLHEGEWEAMRDMESKLGSGLQVEKAPEYRFMLRYFGGQGSDFEVLGAEPKNAQLALRGRAVAALAMHRRVVSEDVLDRVGGVLYLDQHRRGTLHQADQRLDFAETALPWLPDRDVVGWLARMASQHVRWNEATRGPSRWSRVQRLFNALAAPSVLEESVPYDEGEDLNFRAGERGYSMVGTSSGERQVLRLAANLAFYRAERSLLLLDELELNLHPRWQRGILRFCETGAGDDNQVLATTHSDVVLRYAEPSAVVTLGVPKEGWS